MDKKEKISKLFDSVSNRYDLLNHLLSFGIDIYWRKKSIRLSSMNKNSILLDVACGTGDFAIAAKKSGVKNIYGIDLSINMLKLFKKKSKWISDRTVLAVAEKLPFKENYFTHITVAFGIRNFYNIEEGLKSFYNSLADNGQVVSLEFKLPSNKFVQQIYLLYFNKILPKIGGIISGNKEAYQYLSDSVNTFDKNIDLKSYFLEAGFSSVKSYSLTFGTVQITIANK
ncbi:bifunctional demethylmenaquinone methyltransferase/2-methoxy-6-polyprenyl-1,4-benzoquinol methylase UbiE [Bacteroidota bacterium]